MAMFKKQAKALMEKRASYLKKPPPEKMREPAGPPGAPSSLPFLSLMEAPSLDLPTQDLWERLSILNKQCREKAGGLRDMLGSNKKMLVAREFNVNARAINGHLKDPFSRMQALYDVRDGNKIPDFPQMPISVHYMTELDANELLEAMGVTTDSLTLDEKIDRFLLVCGVTMDMVARVHGHPHGSKGV